MDSSFSLVKALATTLLSELDTLAVEDISLEKGAFDLNKSVHEFEIKLIKAALLKTRGNQRRAASILGVKVTTLHNKIKTHKINCIKLSND